MTQLKFMTGLLFIALMALNAPSARAGGGYEILDVLPIQRAPSVDLSQDEITIKKKTGERLFFDVELALSHAEQRKGLMFRKEMQDHTGMLFVFGNTDMRSFWMKNTLIPLDLLFIAKDGEIHHIHHNAKPQDLSGITSLYPSKAVLEINGGLSDRFGIKEGDHILHKIFKNE